MPEGDQTITAVSEGFEVYTKNVHIAQVTTLDIFMRPEKLYASLSGAVSLYGTDLPVASVTVECDGRSTVTDSSGAFLLDSVLHGWHQITAYRNHFPLIQVETEIAGDTSLDLYMPTATLRGLVTHLRDGAIQDVEVTIEGVSTRTGPDGYYLIESAPIGTHPVTLSHTDYNSLETIVSLNNAVNWHSAFLTRTVGDTIPITVDATVATADWGSCATCPDWRESGRNYGQEDRLELAYFRQAKADSLGGFFTGRSHVYLTLPSISGSFPVDRVLRARLLLFPTGETGEPGALSIRRSLPYSRGWSENGVTWENAPDVFTTAFASAPYLSDEPYTIDVTDLYRSGLASDLTVRLQREELGLTDDIKRQTFWSSESSDPSLRPAVIFEYTH